MATIDMIIAQFSREAATAEQLLRDWLAGEEGPHGSPCTSGDECPRDNDDVCPDSCLILATRKYLGGTEEGYTDPVNDEHRDCDKRYLS